MSKDTGDPAFPSNSEQYGPFCGMSLRDYFAVKSLNHALELFPATSKQQVSFAAGKAYEIADAMLAERNK